jgi:hypothetical protein
MMRARIRLEALFRFIVQGIVIMIVNYDQNMYKVQATRLIFAGTVKSLPLECNLIRYST